MEAPRHPRGEIKYRNVNMMPHRPNTVQMQHEHPKPNENVMSPHFNNEPGYIQQQPQYIRTVS